jgi:hypothetical protein
MIYIKKVESYKYLIGYPPSMAAPSLDQAESQLVLLTVQLSAAVAELKSQEHVLFKTKGLIADLEKKLCAANAEVKYNREIVEAQAVQTSVDLGDIQKMIDVCPSMRWQDANECGYPTIFNQVTMIPLPLFSKPTKFVTISCPDDVAFIRLPDVPESYAVRGNSIHGVVVCVLEGPVKFGN